MKSRATLANSSPSRAPAPTATTCTSAPAEQLVAGQPFPRHPRLALYVWHDGSVRYIAPIDPADFEEDTNTVLLAVPRLVGASDAGRIAPAVPLHGRSGSDRLPAERQPGALRVLVRVAKPGVRVMRSERRAGDRGRVHDRARKHRRRGHDVRAEPPVERRRTLRVLQQRAGARAARRQPQRRRLRVRRRSPGPSARSPAAPTGRTRTS